MGLFDKLFGKEKKSTVSTEKAPIPASYKCPHCFEEIEQGKACFLIKAAVTDTWYSEEDIDFMDYSAQQEILTRQNAIEPFLKREEDAPLERYWNEIGGKGVYQNHQYADPEIQWNSPIVEPGDPNHLTENGFEMDEDGFVYAVTDRNFRHRSEVRICPHCHNPLPKFYGKYPIHSISIVGVRDSGKTTYLNQLISDLQKYLGSIGMDRYTIDENASKMFAKIDSTGTFMKTGSTVFSLEPPYTVTIKNSARLDTIVFYDISGENCVRSDRMNKFGRFISNSDGILFMIDPEQFREVAAQNNHGDREILDVASVITTMNDAFLNGKPKDSEGRVKDLPIAIVVSKSDFMVDNLAKNPKWKNSLITRNVTTPNQKINTDELMLIKKNVREIINEYAPDSNLVGLIDRCFCNYSYFAVTALGCNTKKVFANKDMQVVGAYLIDENGERATTLRITMDEDARRSINNHLNNYELLSESKSPFMAYDAREGGKFFFDRPCLSIDDYNSRVVIQFEINPEKGTIYEMVPQTDRNGNLSWKQGARFKQEKVPEHIPQPRRIEEPLYWLLSEFELAQKW